MTSTLNINLKTGDKIKFEDDDLVFKVMAKNNRFIICTNNDLGLTTDETVYTIIDSKEQIRGPHNLIFNCYDFTSIEEMVQLIEGLMNPDDVVEISYRNRVSLKVESVYYEV